MKIIPFLQSFFGFWPLLFSAVLVLFFKNKDTWEQKFHISLRVFFGLWLIWLALGISLLFSQTTIPLLIPDPWNTLGFSITGLIAGVLLFYQEWNAWGRIRQTLENARTIEEIYQLSPVEFEELIAEFFRKHGYKTHRVGSSGDHGVDLVVETPRSKRWIVQCKRWKGQVGEPVVRDFYGTMVHEKADQGFLITTGVFSQAAKEWAKGKPIKLVDGNLLIRMVREVQHR